MLNPHLADRTSDVLQTWMHDATETARRRNRQLAIVETLAGLETEPDTKDCLEELCAHLTETRDRELTWAQTLEAELTARHDAALCEEAEAAAAEPTTQQELQDQRDEPSWQAGAGREVTNATREEQNMWDELRTARRTN